MSVSFIAELSPVYCCLVCSRHHLCTGLVPRVDIYEMSLAHDTHCPCPLQDKYNEKDKDKDKKRQRISDASQSTKGDAPM